jgi:hypothetical protein
VRGPPSIDEKHSRTRPSTRHARKAGISAAQVATDAGSEIMVKMPLNWVSVRAIVQAIDRYAPGGSGATIALAMQEVINIS